MSNPDDNEMPAEEEEETRDPGGEGETAVPEGMRVVRKRRKRKSEASRQTLYLKKREILREMHTEEDGLSLKGQVERLKEVAKAKEVPMEDKWGSVNHRRRGSRWVILAVAAVALPLVVMFVVLAVTRKPGGVTTGTSSSLLNLDEPVEAISAFDRTSPQAWFHENSVKAYDLAVQLLEQCNAAEHPAQLAEIVRDSERVLPKISVEDVEGASDYFLSDPREISWEYGNAGGAGYMVLMGRRADYTSFRAYFVKTDKGLKLDWEATWGLSDIPVQSLVAEGKGKTVLIRGWVGKQPYYDTEKGRASTQSWYIILEPGREEFVWAYAPTGSNLDEQLRGILSYGRMVESRPDEVRATIRLNKPSLGFRENEFEIQELVTTDWVVAR